jgi:hypothetical protein
MTAGQSCVGHTSSMSLDGNVLSVPLGGEEILIMVGGQPRVGGRRKALGFTEFSAVRAGPRAESRPYLAAFPSAAALRAGSLVVTGGTL